jgi:DNA helicase-2/ATP-dependent DNA helicase PcrA
MSYLKQLDTQQYNAVTAPFDRHVLVSAGPGSGKTRVLTSRLMYLLDNQISPDQVLAVTFTNKAGNEMKERICSMTNIGLNRLNIGTFHSFCARWLRYYAEYAGIKSNYIIYDQNDSLTLLKEICSVKNYIKPQIAATVISGWKSTLVTPEGAKVLELMDDSKDIKRINRQNTNICISIYEKYQKALINNNALDFDDLLMKMICVLQDYPEIVSRLGFDYIMVDESQDMNYTQYALVQAFLQKGSKIFLVGDIDQSIYAFRNADVKLIDRFIDDCDPLVINLVNNYRSTKEIVRAASFLISNNESRIRKSMKPMFKQSTGLIKVDCLHSPKQEAEHIASSINMLISSGYDYKDIAILCRISSVFLHIEQVLLAKKIPYQIQHGAAITNYAIIKGLIAYMKVFSNPKDRVALKRVLLLQSNIGEKKASNFLRLFSENSPDTVKDLIMLIGKYCKFDWNNIPDESLYRDIRIHNDGNPFIQLAQDFAYLLPYKDNLKIFVNILLEIYFSLPKVLVQLNEVSNNQKNSIGIFKNKTLPLLAKETSTFEDLLQLFSLSSAQESDNKDGVTINTIHGAKGLEWPIVFLCRFEEGIIPLNKYTDTSIEEERRLAFVGVTRAKEQLYVTHTALDNSYSSNKPSRFLEEMKLFEFEQSVS